MLEQRGRVRALQRGRGGKVTYRHMFLGATALQRAPSIATLVQARGRGDVATCSCLRGWVATL